MCFPRSDLLNDITSEDVIENDFETDPEEEEEEFEESDEEFDCHECPECIQRTNQFLLKRLNHVLKKCKEEEMEEGDWSEIKPENQMRVFLYVSKLKEGSDGQEESVPDELEEEFNDIVDHIMTTQHLVIHWISKIPSNTTAWRNLPKINKFVISF